MALTEGVRKIVATSMPGVRMPCAEAVAYGDLVAIDANGQLEPVDSDDAEHGRGVALTPGDTDKDAMVCFGNVVIDGFTGGTEGAAIYPSSTPGSYTETADTDSGDSDEIVGYILTETMILVIPGARADSTAS